MQRCAFRLVILCALTLLPGAATASPTAQPLAPDNLRCPGRSLPNPPERWRWEWHWEILDAYHFAGRAAGENPYAVALDRGCNLYVADTEANQVVKLSPDGEILARLPTPRQDPGESGLPQGVAVDGQGNVYASYHARNRILKFSPGGQLIATWGLCTPAAENRFCDPSQGGLFVGPRGLAVDGAGNVYVMEIGRIQKLTPDGQPIAVWNMAGRAPGEQWILGQPALDLDGNLYVPDEFNNRVLKFSPDGVLVAQFGGGPDPSPAPGRFANPTSVAVDQAGQMFVAERYNWRVQKLAPDGTSLDMWRNCLDGPLCQNPANGDRPGEFFNSTGMTVDGQGNLYVADGGNMRVQRLIATAVPIPPQDLDSSRGGDERLE